MNSSRKVLLWLPHHGENTRGNNHITREKGGRHGGSWCEEEGEKKIHPSIKIYISPLLLCLAIHDILLCLALKLTVAFLFLVQFFFSPSSVFVSAQPKKILLPEVWSRFSFFHF